MVKRRFRLKGLTLALRVTDEMSYRRTLEVLRMIHSDRLRYDPSVAEEERQPVDIKQLRTIESSNGKIELWFRSARKLSGPLLLCTERAGCLVVTNVMNWTS